MGIRPQGVAPWMLACILLLGFSCDPAGAKEGWKTLVGKQPPGFRVEQWLNTDGADPQPKDLAGKVWVLQFLSVG